MTISTHNVFAAIAERFRRILDALYAKPAGPRVIHADLHQENVKVYRGRLRPLDFYEAIWGYPVQDVALTLYDLRYYADCRPYGEAALRAAFSAGYASRRPWPEQYQGQIETLIAGRRLRQANWVLEHETAPFAQYGFDKAATAVATIHQSDRSRPRGLAATAVATLDGVSKRYWPFAADPSATPDPTAILRFFERLDAEFRAWLAGLPSQVETS